MEHMQRCFDLIFGDGARLQDRNTVSVLDLGAQDVNGSYRSIFDSPRFDFTGADLEAGRGVDVVLDDPYKLPFADSSVDVVLSGQMLEHCEFFWLAFEEMTRVVAQDGFIVLIAPSGGPIHRYPVDCYRYYPDAYAALAKLTGCHLLDLRHDERGPWYDLVGIFSPTPQELPSRPHRQPVVIDVPSGAFDPVLDRCRGSVPYREVLAAIHERLQPELYLEIGVRDGGSLALARCPAVGVDPAPQVNEPADTATIHTATSDDFFAYDADEALPQPPDLAFIDGLHLFEYVLRDFMNIERRAQPASLIVIDDLFPNHPAQGRRDRTTRVWTGDVWKILLCLREHRPDLTLLPLDSHPTGLLLVAGLDPTNRVLWHRYNSIITQYKAPRFAEPTDDLLERAGALSPTDDVVPAALDLLRDARSSKAPAKKVRRRLRALTR